MTIENNHELGEAKTSRAIEVHGYTVDALKGIPIPRKVVGGCTIMPRRGIMTAEDPSYQWEIDDVNKIIRSLRGPHVSVSITSDIANLIGNIIMSLRRGERIVIEEEPAVRIYSLEEIRQQGL